MLLTVQGLDQVEEFELVPDVQEGMLNRVEAAIRAYDPCLSCSTHAIGQMPIQVEILDPDGKLIRTLQRDSA